MKDENKQSIDSRVAIYLNDDKTYTVRRADKGWTIQSGIKTPDEALAIKRAYVFGYIDGREETKEEPKQQ